MKDNIALIGFMGSGKSTIGNYWGFFLFSPISSFNN